MRTTCCRSGIEVAGVAPRQGCRRCSRGARDHLQLRRARSPCDIRVDDDRRGARRPLAPDRRPRDLQAAIGCPWCGRAAEMDRPRPTLTGARRARLMVSSSCRWPTPWTWRGPSASIGAARAIPRCGSRRRAAIWRTSRTAEGPVTLFLQPAPDLVRVRAWGPGSASRSGGGSARRRRRRSGAARRAPLRRCEAVRRLRGLRIGRTGAVMEALVPAILEQKVTGDEARRACSEPRPASTARTRPGRRACACPPAPRRARGAPLPRVPPAGRRAAARRADPGRRARRAPPGAPGRAGDHRPARRPAPAYAALRAIPGIGPWTAAEVGFRAFGDPDAVSVGDFHLPNMVSWALAGEPRGTDERMLELLEPYRGQRGRVLRLLELTGVRPPRYGPRLSPRRIERI